MTVPPQLLPTSTTSRSSPVAVVMPAGVGEVTAGRLYSGAARRGSTQQGEDND